MSTAALRKRARKYEIQHGGRPRGMSVFTAKKALLGLIEKKVIDTAEAAYACNTTGSVTLVNGCAQGTDFTNRVGRKYTNLSVQMQGKIHPVDTTTGSTKCRVMLVFDTQPNGALPSITDVLTASTSNSFMNLNNRDRFKVLCDHNVVVGAVSDVATQAFAMSPTVHNVSFYKKISLETINDGTSAAIGDIQSGSIFLLTIGDQGAGLGASFVGAIRVRFADA